MRLQGKTDEKEKMLFMIQKGYKYNPKTGEVFGPSGDKIVSIKNGYPYFACTYDGRVCHTYVHRFAYFCQVGQLPTQLVHMDGDRANNVWENLLDVKDNKEKAKYMNKSNDKIIVEKRAGGTVYTVSVSFNYQKFKLITTEDYNEAQEIVKKYDENRSAFIREHITNKVNNINKNKKENI